VYFDEHLARVGPERLWVAERAGPSVDELEDWSLSNRDARLRANARAIS
jgi:hypothetical protein